MPITYRAEYQSEKIEVFSFKVPPLFRAVARADFIVLSKRARMSLRNEWQKPTGPFGRFSESRFQVRSARSDGEVDWAAKTPDLREVPMDVPIRELVFSGRRCRG